MIILITLHILIGIIIVANILYKKSFIRILALILHIIFAIITTMAINSNANSAYDLYIFLFISLEWIGSLLLSFQKGNLIAETKGRVIK